MKYVALTLAAIGLAGCANDADVASRNLSQAADNFEINRRVVFYNMLIRLTHTNPRASVSSLGKTAL